MPRHYSGQWRGVPIFSSQCGGNNNDCSAVIDACEVIGGGKNGRWESFLFYPITSKCQPVTSMPQLITSMHQPITSGCQPITSIHQPITSMRQPITSMHQPITHRHHNGSNQPELFPAVTVPRPSNRKAGFNLLSFSMVVSLRGNSSLLTTTSPDLLLIGIGKISRSKEPSCCACLHLSCEWRAKRSCC